MPTKEPPQFNDLVEAARIADRQIADVHRGLSDIRIRWVLSSEEAGSKGCEQYARIVIRKPLERWLGLPECRFDHEDLAAPGGWEDAPAVAIIIPSEVWPRLPDAQKEALIDHLLTHLYVNPETGKITKAPHDVSEFIRVRERHGDWHAGLRRFAKARAPQMPLDLDGAAAEPAREAVGAGV